LGSLIIFKHNFSAKAALVELAVVAYNDKLLDQRLRRRRASAVGNLLARASITTAGLPAGLPDMKQKRSSRSAVNGLTA
jgi:hypothetical protein